MSPSRIPLSVIGGYLGAGKTTLINRILRGDHGVRIAVIVNDFGDVAIDDALLEPATGGMRVLANGCVCCAAVDGLGTALEEIAALEPPPEHVLIEVSGVGDPWAVAQWGRTPGYELDGVVVLADPTELPRWVDDAYVGDTVRQQLQSADIIVISRVDVAAVTAVENASALIASITPAPILLGSDVVLGLLVGPTSVGEGRTAAHAAHAARSFTPRRSTRDELDAWLAEAPSSIVRAKGFVEFDGGTLLGQRVGRRVEVTRHSSRQPSQMVVIAAEQAISPPVDAWIRLLS